ncbi:DUF4143 domain-containing protein [Sphingobacterium alkalisoli]|uniref:DUF4143 domain-containing protein n=1 Tax=Sphingobacterium alkalisoli TaxID=1874115 RepID=A0A4U0GYQ3_9SPHI|nr:DUF4143 domain-containing protein [Sphingobacterium alkalisoli]
MPSWASPYFYRTAAGAEVDLVIDAGSDKRIAIEIKRSMTPTLSKGFMNGCDDIQATHRFFLCIPVMSAFGCQKMLKRFHLK